jgi:uncharacterized protein (TIGR03086 family)
MDSSTKTPPEATPDSVDRMLAQVLSDLADLIGQIGPEQFADPTPCTEYDVGALRAHVLGWLTHFATAFQDPDGVTDRPDPTTHAAPDDPAEAAAMARAAAARIADAIEHGVAGRPVRMVSASMPGESMLQMALWEYLVHGSDLARSTGRPWNPPAGAAENALSFAPLMLTDDYRGPGKNFAAAVSVPAEAPPLDQLLAFSGRDPRWNAGV